MRHCKLGFIRCVLRAALPGMLALIERSRVSAAAIEADVRSYNMVLSRQLVENDLAAAAETCEIMQARRHHHSSVVSRWPSSPSVSSTLSAPCSAAARFFCRMLYAAEGLAEAGVRAGGLRLKSVGIVGIGSQARGIERDLVGEKLALELAELQTAAAAAPGEPARHCKAATRYSQVSPAALRL
jgi:hypothetical protein